MSATRIWIDSMDEKKQFEAPIEFYNRYDGKIKTGIDLWRGFLTLGLR